MNEVDTPDNWQEPQHILVVLAHPDDLEFFCGATVARWTTAGHRVSYCLLTCGEKGTQDREIPSDELCSLRQSEQIAAAAVLGVHEVRFLNYPDGYLLPDLELRRDITRVLRQEQPDVVVTCDPTNLYVRDTYLNHPDHRATGQATLDAVSFKFYRTLARREFRTTHRPRGLGSRPERSKYRSRCNPTLGYKAPSTLGAQEPDQRSSSAGRAPEI